MKNYFGTLTACMLFTDIPENDIDKMLHCFQASIKKYKKDSAIILADDEIHSVGIVLSGAVQVVKEDYLGHKNLLTELSASEIFAETFVCAGVTKSPVTVLSITKCEILFIDYRKMIAVCPSACEFHTRFVENMLRLIANKNLMLNQKISFLSRRTTREKLLLYLSVEAEKAQSSRFTISFSRHALADFLCVDRSAMSRELGRLRDEGVLRFNGGQFELLNMSAPI